MLDLINDCLVILFVEFRRRLYMFYVVNMKWYKVIFFVDGNLYID